MLASGTCRSQPPKPPRNRRVPHRDQDNVLSLPCRMCTNQPEIYYLCMTGMVTIARICSPSVLRSNRCYCHPEYSTAFVRKPRYDANKEATATCALHQTAVEGAKGSRIHQYMRKRQDTTNNSNGIAPNITHGSPSITTSMSAPAASSATSSPFTSASARFRRYFNIFLLS